MKLRPKQTPLSATVLLLRCSPLIHPWVQASHTLTKGFPQLSSQAVPYGNKGHGCDGTQQVRLMFGLGDLEDHQGWIFREDHLSWIF